MMMIIIIIIIIIIMTMIMIMLMIMIMIIINMITCFLKFPISNGPGKLSFYRGVNSLLLSANLNMIKLEKL